MNTNGKRNKNAIEYLRPAKVIGEISLNPFLIIMNDVDQRKVTNNASIIAAVLDNCFLILILPQKITYLKKVLWHTKVKTGQIFFLELHPEEKLPTLKRSSFQL